jgi:hypothetical protein
MKERYVITIEAVGLALLVGLLIYSVGVFVAAAMVFAIALIVTAQIVKPR